MEVVFLNNPVLSIDVSKSYSCAKPFYAYGQPFSKHFLFEHTHQNASDVLELLVDLENETGIEPKVVMEATGNFSKPLKRFFSKNGYQVVELNPILTHKQKRKSIRKVKTDPIDTNRIAEVYYLNSSLYSQKITDEDIEELKVLCRHLEAVNETFRELQLKFRSVIDLVFPRFDTVFYKLCSLTSLKVIEKFPTPNAVLDANKDELESILRLSRKPRSWSLSKIDELRTAAGESLPYDSAQKSLVRVLRSYVKLLLTHMDTLSDLRAQIIKQAELSPAFTLLRSIPGVGELTAATIIGEVGDISRFNTVKKLVAFSGLDPSVYESGKFKSSNNRISKRGSSHLRKALYQAACAGIRKPNGSPNNQLLYDYYTRKVDEGKAKKVAIVAAAHKLLRIVYAVWKKGEMFRG